MLSFGREAFTRRKVHFFCEKFFRKTSAVCCCCLRSEKNHEPKNICACSLRSTLRRPRVERSAALSAVSKFRLAKRAKRPLCVCIIDARSSNQRTRFCSCCAFRTSFSPPFIYQTIITSVHLGSSYIQPSHLFCFITTHSPDEFTHPIDPRTSSDIPIQPPLHESSLISTSRIIFAFIPPSR